jgi:hypothetical protein
MYVRLSQDATEEDEGIPPPSPQLGEAFVDDAYGTAKSYEDLKKHKDYKKWLKVNGMTAAAVESVEKRLGLYQVSLLIPVSIYISEIQNRGCH